MPYRRIVGYHRDAGCDIDTGVLVGADIEGEHYILSLLDVRAAFPNRPHRVLRLISYDEDAFTGEVICVSDHGIIGMVMEEVKREHKLKLDGTD
ncbi:MAG: hypothetical protein KKG75_00410 [Nanoarchaeota archaeon]|nr:hypothetical protein [Nanoarchaeota archaeon]